MNPLLLDDKNMIKCSLTLQVDTLPNMFVGGDIKSLVEPRVAQNAINDGFLIAHNILLLNAGKKLMKRGGRGSPALSERIAFGFSTGIKSGIFIQPIGKSKSLVFPTPAVTFIKEELRAGMIHLMYCIYDLMKLII